MLITLVEFFYQILRSDKGHFSKIGDIGKDSGGQESKQLLERESKQLLERGTLGKENNWLIVMLLNCGIG